MIETKFEVLRCVCLSLVTFAFEMVEFRRVEVLGRDSAHLQVLPLDHTNWKSRQSRSIATIHAQSIRIALLMHGDRFGSMSSSFIGIRRVVFSFLLETSLDGF